MIIIVALGLIVGNKYVYSLFTLPIAANNIYEQQYQMHRFVVDYYRKPVAINDLGYVSYKNNNYVLDLAGLGSAKVLNYTKNSDNALWMKTLSDNHHTKLAMIYPDWFKSIPNEWIRIGELRLGKARITPARDRVAFYATRQDAYGDIVRKLEDFIKTLPHGVVFAFENKAVHGYR